MLSKTYVRGCAAIALLMFAGVVHGGRIENHSYPTLCAEMDNINIPIYNAGVSAYRITALHPRYYPSSISAWAADWDDCTFAVRDIWMIGAAGGQSSEFLQTGFTNGDTFFAPDDPAEGVDESVTNMPREINNDWFYDQYIRFTANEDSDVNLEARIGSKLTVALATIAGTLEIQIRTFGTNGWVDQGSEIFDSGNLVKSWDIPDLTWLEGTDTNVINIHVVRESDGGASTTNAWAYYDYLELRKRDEDGDNSDTPTTLYDDTNTIVETVHIDFWWRYPEAMTVSVVGGGVDTNAHYFRIKRRKPGTPDFYHEVFVLYEDGNARIIPRPPLTEWNIPYGASMILGASSNSARPYAEVNTVVYDPDDMSLDLTYGDGSTAHVELRMDDEMHVLDISDITYDTTNLPFARFRSMWVVDGKTDVDRVQCTDGIFPIMDSWSSVNGEWWHFYKEVPSYHNTYCPEFRVEVMDSSNVFYSCEAESRSWGTNCWAMFPRSFASGGTTLYMSVTGAVAQYDMTLSKAQPATWMRIKYAILDGGDYIDDLANSLHVVVDGVFTSAVTYAVETGGQSEYEWLPSLYLGDLSAGAHQLHIFTGAGTNHLELDRFELVSQPSRGWIRKSLYARQAESFDYATNYQLWARSSCDVVHLEHTGSVYGAVTYNIDLPEGDTNCYLRLRYTDDIGPNMVRVFLDGELTAKFPSESTGSWDTQRDSPMLFLGTLTAGTHQIRFDSSLETFGVDLDEFEIFAMFDNRSPILSVPGPHAITVGAATNFEVDVTDPDGDVTSVTNAIAPVASLFVTNWFEWSAAVGSGGTTNEIVFVADDGRGLTNSVVTNRTVVVVPWDSDADGLGDDWEWGSFGLLTNEPAGDVDGDGADNEFECIAGTDADDANSIFVLGSVTGLSESVHYITVPTAPERLYSIYYADGIEGDWLRFANTNLGVGCWVETSEVETVFTFTDDETISTSGGAPSNGIRLYKVKVSTK